jgi:hypothetical protein
MIIYGFYFFLAKGGISLNRFKRLKNRLKAVVGLRLKAIGGRFKEKEGWGGFYLTSFPCSFPHLFEGGVHLLIG